MADFPSFFTRVDFIGKYLPGYVLVIAYIFLFKSSLIFDNEFKLDVDLLTALVFIVAGPSLGYTITHFHRILPYIRISIFELSNKSKHDRLKKSIRKYAKLRTLLTEDEKPN